MGFTMARSSVPRRRSRAKPSLQRLAQASAVARFGVVAIVGVALGAVAAVWSPWQSSILCGWSVAGASLVAWVWVSVGHFDADQTRSHATREDNSRVSTQLLLVSASVASLAGAGLDLVKASHAHGAGKAALDAIAVVTVIASWSVVHTAFALRYAHEFYTPPVGGIDFKNSDDPPDYQDFAYVAFTVGMTFQVSDTDIQKRTIRRTVLRHALLAYLFGAVILAVTVNVIASVFQ
jgi:uncharacterized membrane protein